MIFYSKKGQSNGGSLRSPRASEASPFVSNTSFSIFETILVVKIENIHSSNSICNEQTIRNKMNEFMGRLPLEVIFFHIIPYTYNIQSKYLLEDIVSYTHAKTLLTEMYYNFWILFAEDTEPEDKNWLLNDIYTYANEDNATMNGYVENFYNIYRRNIMLDSKEKIDQYISNLREKNDVKKQINIFMALLSAKERNEFIENRKSFYHEVILSYTHQNHMNEGLF